ncbi:MAG: exonuclease SbcCD subunit D C-terminal domain-containing protein [Alcaligenaceae bacterium]|nr:exonuclease SbcCD subunit D C-terminal domain-containing protein [Alcaligenaceae bacterium]
MRILHTSDWHLGRSLLGKRRYAEFTQLLDWMLQCIEQWQIEVLIIAGDIFDTTTPSVTAQDQYYNFLASAATKTNCRHIVVIGGNHDSASFLNAPGAILKNLNVHVVGQACENIQDEVLLLDNSEGDVGLVIAAVPFLSDRDIRHYVPLESLADKDLRVVEAYHQHYHQVAEHATQLAAQHAVPMVATGHLFMTGGLTLEGDGVRDLYVGTLGQLKTDLFSPNFNYVALGHIHQAQKIAGLNHIRYSGSPLPMCFDECRRPKNVLIVDFDEHHEAQVTAVTIPTFQRLEKISGDLKSLLSQLEALKTLDESIWLEVTYQSDELQPNLRAILMEQIKDSSIEILKLINHQRQSLHLQSAGELERLNELRVEDVFNRLLDRQNIPATQRIDLLNTYQETLHRLQQDEETELSQRN